MNTQNQRLSETSSVNFKNHGLSLVRRNGIFYLRIESDEGEIEKMVDQSHGQDYQGEISVPNARLKYWFDEARRQWHFNYLYESDVQGEFTNKWGTDQIVINADGIQDIEASESPDAPGSLLRIMNFEMVAILSIFVVAWGIFSYLN